MAYRPATYTVSSGPFDVPPPRDLIALLAVLFVTFTLQFFDSTAWLIELTRLTPAVWQNGFLWQLVTYPFAGSGPPSAWFLLALLILFWFSRDVRMRLGRARFWRLLVTGSLVAAVVAVLARLAFGDVAGPLRAVVFGSMQGQWMLSTLTIAAFAVMFPSATIRLFFVLPIRAAWFLPLELLMAFIAFLANRDFAALLGIFAGVGTVWLTLQSGTRLTPREIRLRIERWLLERRMARLRKKSGLRVVRGERSDVDRWVH